MGIKIRQDGQWVEVASGSGGSSDPVGTIVAWAGSVASIPSEYKLCDGSPAPASLQSIVGANLPDLRDKFIIGAGNNYSVNATGGSANAVLIAHNHSYSRATSDEILRYEGYDGPDQTNGASFDTSSTGTTGINAAGASNSTQTGTNANLPPYYALCYIIKHTATSGGGSGGVTSTWTLGANGSSHYTFTGPGGLSNTDDPKIYLARGQTYEFVNNSGGSHPFQIQQSNGSAYGTGVTNNGASSGTIRFEVPFSAPNTLQYKCTSHSSMGNTIIIYPDLSP